MATRNRVGLDHLTVVPENFDREATSLSEPRPESETEVAGSGDE